MSIKIEDGSVGRERYRMGQGCDQPVKISYFPDFSAEDSSGFTWICFSEIMNLSESGEVFLFQTVSVNFL